MNRAAGHVKRNSLSAALKRVDTACHLFIRLLRQAGALLVCDRARSLARGLAGCLAFAAACAYGTLN